VVQVRAPCDCHMSYFACTSLTATLPASPAASCLPLPPSCPACQPSTPPQQFACLLSWKRVTSISPPPSPPKQCLQSAFIWGYLATQLLGGTLADKLGGECRHR